MSCDVVRLSRPNVCLGLKPLHCEHGQVKLRFLAANHLPHDPRRNGRQQDAIAEVAGSYAVSGDRSLSEDGEFVGGPRAKARPIFEDSGFS